MDPKQKQPTPDNPKDTAYDWCELTLTHKCNQRCFFCYEDGRDIAKDPGLDEVKRLLRATHKRAEVVVLCGKEVMLRRDILDIVAYAASIGLKPAVFTNGQALARTDIIPQLVDAGCASVEISFHFPDPETFARGTRTSPEGFRRTIRGLQAVAEYNRAHPHAPLRVSTETDMSTLNAGRLIEMRQTLLDAFGETQWKMRVASLLPTKVYDIGLEHALHAVEPRRAELKAFVESHPPQLPLRFIKTPLCLIPPGHEQLSLDLEYLYEGTTLTFNHSDADEIEIDTWSMSAARDHTNILRQHPYRWLCRGCNLVSLCRFERVAWRQPSFEPRRDQKPIPRQDTTIADIFSRFGDNPSAVLRSEEITQALRRFRYPEEEILAALADAGDAPRLIEAFVQNEPIAAIVLEQDGWRTTLQLGAPRDVDTVTDIGAVVGYLQVQPLAPEPISKERMRDCLKAISSVEFPELARWQNDVWFDVNVARLYRSAWLRFGEELWPGLGQLGGWRTQAVRLTPHNALQIEMLSAENARALLEYRVEPDTEERGASCLVSVDAGNDTAATEVKDLLTALTARLTEKQAAIPDLTPQLASGTPVALGFEEDRWWLHDTTASSQEEAKQTNGPGSLEFVVIDRNASDIEYRFHVALDRPEQAYFKKIIKKPVAKQKSEKTPFPENPSPGFGKKTIKEICQIYTLPYSKIINKIKKAGYKIQENDTVKEIGINNNSNPMVIFEIIKKVSNE